ncbi:hypothetical protein [Serratia marcescens]|uniref:hypothetical protein n=1 Tax=Serratia marcescens TaxID=615 RepID=UPI0013DBAB38|nr:hypothetical protein [Serratia marcescens]
MGSSFLLSAVGIAGFIAAYVAFVPHSTGSAGTSNRWLGASLGVALAGLAFLE